MTCNSSLDSVVKGIQGGFDKSINDRNIFDHQLLLGYNANNTYITKPSQLLTTNADGTLSAPTFYCTNYACSLRNTVDFSNLEGDFGNLSDFSSSLYGLPSNSDILVPDAAIPDSNYCLNRFGQFTTPNGNGDADIYTGTLLNKTERPPGWYPMTPIVECKPSEDLQDLINIYNNNISSDETKQDEMKASACNMAVANPGAFKLSSPVWPYNCSDTNHTSCGDFLFDYCNGLNLNTDVCKTWCTVSNPPDRNDDKVNLCRSRLNSFCSEKPQQTDPEKQDIQDNLCACFLGDKAYIDMAQTIEETYQYPAELINRTPECMYMKCKQSPFKDINIKSCPAISISNCFQDVSISATNDSTVNVGGINEQASGCTAKFKAVSNYDCVNGYCVPQTNGKYIKDSTCAGQCPAPSKSNLKYSCINGLCTANSSGIYPDGSCGGNSCSNPSQSQSLSTPVIIGLSVGGGVLLIIILVIIIMVIKNKGVASAAASAGLKK